MSNIDKIRILDLTCGHIANDSAYDAAKRALFALVDALALLR
jgi:hypothetical protein